MDYFSDEYAKAYNQSPKSNLSPAEKDGKLRTIYASVTLGAEITTADKLYLCKLPGSAVMREVKLVAAGGTGGTLDLGWGASESEVADANGIIAAIDGSAAVSEVMNLSNKAAAYGKRFAQEVDVVLSASVDSVGWTGDLVELEITYIIE